MRTKTTKAVNQENKNLCPVRKVCGGCQWADIEYKEQLARKQDNIEKLMGKYNCINPIMGNDNYTHYRNKVQVSFGVVNGKVICGNYAPSTHQIVEIKDCMICDTIANDIIQYVKKLILKYRISVFDEYKLKGCMRHLLIRCNQENEYMVVFVVGGFNFKNQEEIVSDLVKKFPCIKTICVNVNKEHTSMILSKYRCKAIYGNGYIEDKIGDLTFRISPESFYQVNKYQTFNLYSKALEYANLSSEETVLDAYCGTGTISLFLAQKSKKVIGVEINKQAIMDAIYNKKINNIDNTDFIVSDAGKYMVQLANSGQKIDVVVMDPPRAGADDKFLSNLVKLSPKKVVYVSCNPITLKDNLNYLCKKGYAVEKIQPVDIFPFTEHIEVITLLTKK